MLPSARAASREPLLHMLPRSCCQFTAGPPPLGPALADVVSAAARACVKGGKAPVPVHYSQSCMLSVCCHVLSLPRPPPALLCPMAGACSPGQPQPAVCCSNTVNSCNHGKKRVPGKELEIKVVTYVSSAVAGSLQLWGWEWLHCPSLHVWLGLELADRCLQGKATHAGTGAGAQLAAPCPSRVPPCWEQAGI